MFSTIAPSYLIVFIKIHFTPGRPVHSNTIMASLGSIQPCCNYCARTISIAKYSFIQLNEMWQCGLNENVSKQ